MTKNTMGIKLPLIGIDDFSRMGAFYCRNDFPFGTKLG